MKAGKEKLVNDIVEMLEKGMDRAKILQEVSKTCKASNRTIDTAIKKAKLVLAERNEHKDQVRLEQTSETIKALVNEALMSDLEVEAILCKIISGQMEVEEILKGEPILRSVTPGEIVSAAKVLFAKRGSNAPTKTNITLGTVKSITIEPISPGKG